MTSDNSDGIWADDLLNRQADAKFLIRFLKNRVEERGRSGRTKSYVLNVDAAWGYGKSFFLNRLKVQLEKEGHLVAFVNAWEDDHAEDPLLSVMAAIDDAVKPVLLADEDQRKVWDTVKRSTSRVVITIAKGAIRQLGRKAIGDAAEKVEEILLDPDSVTEDSLVDETGKVLLDETGKAVSEELDKALDSYAEKLLTDFREGQNAIGIFKLRLKSFVENIGGAGKAPPLFVLIDELDRCRPLYAIELLERVKHIFETDNLVFVIATDTDQLRHSVRAIYGADFDSERYLLRFFDRSYEFEEPLIAQFVRLQVKDHGLNDIRNLNLPPEVSVEHYLTDCFSYFGLSLRDVEQCMDVFRSVVTTWNENAKMEVCVLVPLIVAYQLKRSMEPLEQMKGILDALHLEGRGRGVSWKMTLPHNRSLKINGNSLADRFFQRATKSLPEITTVGRKHDWDGWVTDCFRAEFSAIHGNRWISENEPCSIIRRYPEFIRSAGRLAQRTDDLN